MQEKISHFFPCLAVVFSRRAAHLLSSKIRKSSGEQNTAGAAMVVRPDNGHGVDRSSSFPGPLLRYMPSVQAGVLFYGLFDAHSQPGGRRESTQDPCGDLLLAANTVEIPGPEHHVMLRPNSETVKTTYFEPRRTDLAALSARPEPGQFCRSPGPSEAYLYIIDSH